MAMEVRIAHNGMDNVGLFLCPALNNRRHILQNNHRCSDRWWLFFLRNCFKKFEKLSVFPLPFFSAWPKIFFFLKKETRHVNMPVFQKQSTVMDEDQFLPLYRTPKKSLLDSFCYYIFFFAKFSSACHNDNHSSEQLPSSKFSNEDV